MKILLIGEYSNIHWTLAKALRNMGHRVDVLSHSYLWLNNSDYLYPNRSSIRWGVLKNTFNLLKTLPQLRGYDVVQLVNPYFLELKPELLQYVFQYLKKNNKKIFLGGFEYDFYWIYMCLNKNALRYNDFYANGTFRDTIDNKMAIINWMHGFRGKLNRIIANNCNGIITSLYESYLAYQPYFSGKTKYIPFPIESLPHPQIPFKKIEKVKFYISLKHHREEWKGKDELYSALYKLYYRHPSACEIKQTVFTPYDECEHFMDGCDVMLDQLYSYSPGLNALYAMSKGIVVVGGAEEEHYNLLGEDRLRPIINVRPEGNDIYNKLESLLANTNKISQLSADSIEYIKKHHCPIKVAKECLDFWEKN